MDSGLLLTGGNKGGTLDQCWHFKISTKKWEMMPRLISARYGHRSVSLGGRVYVVGGVGVDDTVLASVEYLNV